jgi:hypothetical protein
MDLRRSSLPSRKRSRRSTLYIVHGNRRPRTEGQTPRCRRGRTETPSCRRRHERTVHARRRTCARDQKAEENLSGLAGPALRLAGSVRVVTQTSNCHTQRSTRRATTAPRRTVAFMVLTSSARLAPASSSQREIFFSRIGFGAGMPLAASSFRSASEGMNNSSAVSLPSSRISK